jgi:hypothetical protein
VLTNPVPPPSPPPSPQGVENVIPKKWGDWLPPVVTKTMNQSLQQTSAVENLGPVLETSMAALMVQVRGRSECPPIASTGEPASPSGRNWRNRELGW